METRRCPPEQHGHLRIQAVTELYRVVSRTSFQIVLVTKGKYRRYGTQLAKTIEYPSQGFLVIAYQYPLVYRMMIPGIPVQGFSTSPHYELLLLFYRKSELLPRGKYGNRGIGCAMGVWFQCYEKRDIEKTPKTIF